MLNVKELRIEMAKADIRSDAELAKSAGVARGTISNLMRGNIPSYETVRKIIDALNLSEQRTVDIFFPDHFRKA